MKTLITLFCSVVLFGINNFQAQTTMDKVNVELSDPGEPGSLEMHVHNGNITVIGEDRLDLEIGFDPKNGGDQDKERNGLKRILSTAVDLDIIEANNNVDVEPGKNQINFVIKVPRNFSLRLSAHHNADIVVRNVAGVLEVQSHHGSIELREVGGTVSAETHHGGIFASLTSVDAKRPMAFSSYHGDVEVSLPANVNCTTRIKHGRGEIFTDFDMNILPTKRDEDVTVDGKRKIKVGGWVQGEIGSGGSEYMFTTYHGDVILRKT